MGIGRALLEKLISHCSAEGVHLLYGLASPSDAGMLALARRLGFEIDRIPGGTTVVVSLELRRPPVRSRKQSKADCGSASAGLYPASGNVVDPQRLSVLGVASSY